LRKRTLECITEGGINDQQQNWAVGLTDLKVHSSS